MSFQPRIPEDKFLALRVRASQLRKERGLTLDALAAEAGMSRRNLTALLNGEERNGVPMQGTLAVWFRISKALGIPMGELMRELD